MQRWTPAQHTTLVVHAHSVSQLKQPNFIIHIANLCDGVIPEAPETDSVHAQVVTSPSHVGGVPISRTGASVFPGHDKNDSYDDTLANKDLSILSGG